MFRADAAFAKPEIYEALEERGVKYAIRIPANDSVDRDIAELLTRPVGRPSHKPVVRYKRFLYQAASWKTARRVVAKVEFHFGELFPRVGFIVTNLTLPSRAVVRFYNKRGTAGVSRQGHIIQSVEVRPRPRDSGLVAGEAPWRESKTVKPSDNMLRKEYAQYTRLQRAVNADVASLPAIPVAETVGNVRKQQELIETSPMRQLSPAGCQRRHGVKEGVSTGEALGARRRKLAEEVPAITVSGKCRRRYQGDGSGFSTVDGRAAKRARREGPGPASTPPVKVRQG